MELGKDIVKDSKKQVLRPTKENLKMPVIFQKINDYNTADTRFTKVKIWLCHIGENFNFSYFTKETLERAIPTLANTPILGHIEDNSKDETDYSDHRRDSSFKYVGQAFGVIGESNNAKFEYRLCDDGIEREYLTVEGLLWNKWHEPIDIMNRDIIKNQSMEIHEDATGYMNDEGIFVFEDFRFFGACVLGLDYEPAMASSTIELVSEEAIQYTVEDYKKEMAKIKEEIDGKLDEFNRHFSINEGSGSENMSKEIKDEDVTKEEVVDEVKVETTKKEEVTTKIVEDEFADKEDEKDEPKKEDEDDKKSDDSEEVKRLKEENAKLKEEIKELKAKLSSYTKAERLNNEKELFAKFTELEGIQEFEALKANASEFKSLSDLEKEIALVFVNNKKNLSFTKAVDASNDNSIKFDNVEEDNNDGYGGLLNRYLKK